MPSFNPLKVVETRTSAASPELKTYHHSELVADLDSSPYIIDAEAERRLLHKLDLVLLPLFTLIYCANFIDRSAVGNAKIAGIEVDLGMTGLDFNRALTVFYVFYICFDIPSNLALKHFGSVWLACTVISFGVISLATAFVRSYRGFLAIRMFLGLSEGGTVSGLAYVLSRYYRRSELVLRVGCFFGVAPLLAGAFGGLLASGLLSVGDIRSVKSWRKIFLVEGIITTGIGLICLIIIPTDPLRSRMLDPAERALALARIDADQLVKTGGRRERTNLKAVLRAFNFNTILCTVCYIFTNISFQGLSLFMPTVVSTLGKFTVVHSQLLTVPPYLVGAAWALCSVYYSFRMKQRAIPLSINALFMVLGYALAVGTKNSHARYAACFFSIAGASPIAPILLSWAAENAAPDTVRAVATAIVPGMGALGAIVGVWTYLPEDAPDFREGNSLNLATSSMVFVLGIVGALYIRWENAKRDRGERDYRLQGVSVEEVERLGHLHPDFRYQT